MEHFADNPKFINAFKRLALLFLVRGGLFDEENARLELKIIEDRIGLVEFVKAFGGCKFCNERYVTMVRVGAKVRKTRKERIDIALTLDRAAEHALFEVEHKNGNY